MGSRVSMARDFGVVCQRRWAKWVTPAAREGRRKGSRRSESGLVEWL